MAGNANWSALGAGGMYGTTAATGGGGSVPTRDALDAARIGQGRVPTAEYPDGYLGNVRSRREDRLLNAIKSRVGDRQYQRGVHKGERIDPGDYLWPDGLDPQRGLRNEARGIRTAPVLALAPAGPLVNDGKANPPNHVPDVLDPKRRSQLGHLAPPWS